MKQSRIFLFILIALLAAVAACSDGNEAAKTDPRQEAEAEDEYRAITEDFKPMIVEFESIPPLVLVAPEDIRAAMKLRGVPDEQIESAVQSGRPYTDDKPVYDFYMQNDYKWRDISARLLSFEDRYRDTRWGDDALFLMTLLPYMPGRSIETNAAIKTSLKGLVVERDGITLEPYTMDNYSGLQTVKSIVDDRVALLPKEMPFDDKVYALYKFSYAVILIQEGDRDGGRELLKEIQHDYEGSYMAKVVGRELAGMTELRE